MNVPLESLRNKVTTFFHEVIETAAKRSCWWYGVCLDANDPDSLAQLCGISNLALETMFDACGFILPGKLNRDDRTNFAQGILTCNVTEGKPAAFKKNMFTFEPFFPRSTLFYHQRRGEYPGKLVLVQAPCHYKSRGESQQKFEPFFPRSAPF
jgi:hypothetical protein